MAYNRDGHAVTVLDGMIYAIGNGKILISPALPQTPSLPPSLKLQTPSLPLGGHDGKQTLDCVECYNPSSREWKPVTPMTNARRGLGAGTLHNQIYAIGITACG